MKNKQSVCSVIVPVYNVENYLGECLDSLLNQTYSNIEIIVVDDVSTDGSREIAKEYAQRFPNKLRLIEHKVNTRQGGARNTGIEAASGDYLMFLDSDDYLKPDTLETLVSIMEKKNADIVECCFSYVDEQGNYLRKSCFADRIARLGEHRPLLISEMGPCNKLFLASLFRDTGIRFPEKYYYEDYWTVPKVLLTAKNVVYIDDPLYCYRQRAVSTMHDTNIMRNKDIMLGTDELLRYFRETSVHHERFAELEYLAVEHVLYHATLRVNTIDWRNDFQKELKAFMLDRFPNYRKNRYWYVPTKREQRIYKFIEKEQYLLVYLSWCCRNRISGVIKRLFFKLTGGSCF